MRPLNQKKLEEIEAEARHLAEFLDVFLNQDKKGEERTKGFGLVVFSFEGPELTWVSNSDREDMAKALRELLARWKSGHRNEAITNSVRFAKLR